MLAWGVTPEQVEKAARTTGVRLRNGATHTGKTERSALTFLLGLDQRTRRADGSLRYQRVSMNRYMEGRRVAAVCWHGHRDFLRALFALAPDARVKTALADYRGALDFERSYRQTFGDSNGWNVGLSYGQACTCTEEGSDDA